MIFLKLKYNKPVSVPKELSVLPSTLISFQYTRDERPGKKCSGSSIRLVNLCVCISTTLSVRPSYVYAQIPVDFLFFFFLFPRTCVFINLLYLLETSYFVIFSFHASSVRPYSKTVERHQKKIVPKTWIGFLLPKCLGMTNRDFGNRTEPDIFLKIKEPESKYSSILSNPKPSSKNSYHASSKMLCAQTQIGGGACSIMSRIQYCLNLFRNFKNQNIFSINIKPL